MTDAWEAWLRSLTEPALVTLLERRPDAVRGIPPRSLPDLAQRLVQPRAMSAVLQEMPMPTMQVLEAALALGGVTVGAGELVDFLDGARRADVDAVLGQLVDNAVVVPVGGRFALPSGLDELFPDPLRLGAPMRVLMNDASVEVLRRTGRTLGLPRVQQNRALTMTAVLAALHEPGRLTALLAAAPPGVVAELTTATDPASDPYGYGPSGYRRRQDAIEWARSAGLLLHNRVGPGLRTPAELTRVLRGPDFRAPFTPKPPGLQHVSVSRKRIEAETSASAAAFAAAALAILDRVASGDVAAVAAGGVGSRELNRLVKVTGIGDADIRLVLELAYAAGLVGSAGKRLQVGAGFAGFRDGDPAERYAVLLETWLGLGATPTEARDVDGKALPAAARRATCGGCRLARTALLEALGEVDGAVDRSSATRVALWRRPLAHAVPGDDGLPLGATWREAEILGVVALGALTAVGRSLGDGAALRAVAAQLLPPSIDVVRFGADLTAYVAGAPSSRVSALLDKAADRESAGGAVTWRFSAPSIRRALDDGATGEELDAALAAVASAGLPQALEVLIADVARRHGNIRVGPAVTVLRIEDEALLAEVVRDRRLKALELRAVTSTVLAGERPVAETLAALRKAGYFPLAEPRPGDPTADVRRAQHEAVLQFMRGSVELPVAAPVVEEPVDLTALAARLRKPGVALSALISRTEQELGALAQGLSGAEIRQLAHAVDEGLAIGIGYRSASGAFTERVVDSLQLMGGTLAGWCELRQDDRMFSVRGIVSVWPV